MRGLTPAGSLSSAVVAIIYRDLGLLLILTPHTASSAVGKVLREELGGEWLPPAHIQSRTGRTVVRKKHCTAGDLVRHDVLTRPELDDLHVFTTVRNPFGRLVSVYHKRRDSWAGLADDPDSWVHLDRAFGVKDLKAAAELDFTGWVARRYAGNPVRRAAIATGAFSMFRRFTRDADTVMRFEQVQDDFDDVLKAVGQTRVEIPPFNSTMAREPDYREYYDAASRRLVERAARWDLRTFAYEF